VNESLLGKRVKCRQCGQAIIVSHPEPASQNWGEMGIGVESSSSTEDRDIDLAQASAEGPNAGGDGGGCPECGAKVAGKSVVCFSCGYNFRTKKPGRGGAVGGGRKSVLQAAMSEEPASQPRRQVGGGPHAEVWDSVDKYLGIAVLLMTLAGLTMWVLHIIKVAGGFSTGLVLPVAVVVVLIAAVMGPMMMLGIQVCCHVMHWKPRPDTYQRLMMVLFLPLGVALLCGGREDENPLFAAAMSWVWLVTLGVYVYVFREAVQEWVGTVLSGLAGAVAGWLCVIFAGALVTLVTGDLYREALPPGPWQRLASGSLPKPVEVTPEDPKPEDPKPVAKAPLSSEPLIPPPPPEDPSPPPPEPTPTTPTHTPTHSTPTPVPTPEPTGTSGGLFAHATGAKRQAPTELPAGTQILPQTGTIPPPDEKTPVAPPTFKSLLVSEATQGSFDVVRTVVTSQVPSSYVLVVKNGDGEAILQRWHMDPPELKDEMIVPELASNANTYALSPTGDFLVVLARLPKWELNITRFGTTATKNVALTETLNDHARTATPNLIGFIDSTRFLIRWDFGGRSDFRIMDTTGRPRSTIPTEPYEATSNGIAISPNGKYIAVMNKGPVANKEIILYDTTIATATPKRINPAAEEFINQGMTFSPDSTRLALFAQTKDANMVLTFSSSTAIRLSTVSLRDVSSIDPNVPSRGLLWLKSSPVWIVDGSYFFETTQGRRLGPLQVSSVLSANLLGDSSSTLLMQSPAQGGLTRFTILKMDDAAIETAIEAARRR